MSATGWGPSRRGGRPRRSLRIAGFFMGWGSLVAIVAVLSLALATVRSVEANITRLDLPELELPAAGGPLNLLVVGSDSREGLTREQIGNLVLGDANDDTSGQRSDTVVLVSILPDGGGVNIVSFPRDLPVIYEGKRYKLTETFSDGPQAVVEVINQNFGIPIHHYLEVSVLGFINTVEALGTVEICLDEALVDNKSGANFPEPGCYDMTPRDALTYVRSRQGSRGDFQRIERQQTFLKATIKELVDTRLLFDVPRLLDVVEKAASNVSTDDGLRIGQLQALANQLRGFADGNVPMTTVPAYVQSIDGKSFVIPYAPGAGALFNALETGELLTSRGTPDERAAVELVLWTGGRMIASDRAASTLFYSGFKPELRGRGGIDAESTTTVFFLPGQQEAARWVAATLGAPLRSMPLDIEVPPGTQAVVVVGDDAEG
ncbi:MAG: LCP family protein required for cell wall assembly [Glaciecola sp.]|jgi:LCP family protein required for cell wall assembly